MARQTSYLQTIFTANTTQFTSAVRGATASVKGFAKNAETDLKKVKKTFNNLLTVTGFVIALNAARKAMGNLIQTNRDFSASISDLAAITGISGDQLAKHEKAALSLSQGSKQSASSVAEAFKLIASAKPELIDVNNGIIDTTKSVILLAEASNVSMKDATQAVTGAMNVYGLKAKDAAKITDLFAAASKAGSAEVDNLIRSMVEAGPTAAAAGLSLKQTLLGLEAFGKGKILNEKAGTALKDVVSRLQLLGKDYDVATLGWIKVLDNVKKANFSVEEIKTVFGRGAAKTGILTLLKQRDFIAEIADELDEQGVAAKQAAVQNASFDKVMKGLDNAIKGFYIQIGRAGFVEAFTVAVNAAAAAFKFLADNATAVLGVLGAIGSLGIIALLKKIGTAGLVAGMSIAKGFGSALSAIKKVAKFLKITPLGLGLALAGAATAYAANNSDSEASQENFKRGGGLIGEVARASASAASGLAFGRNPFKGQLLKKDGTDLSGFTDGIKKFKDAAKRNQEAANSMNKAAEAFSSGVMNMHKDFVEKDIQKQLGSQMEGFYKQVIDPKSMQLAAPYQTEVMKTSFSRMRELLSRNVRFNEDQKKEFRNLADAIRIEIVKGKEGTTEFGIFNGRQVAIEQGGGQNILPALQLLQSFQSAFEKRAGEVQKSELGIQISLDKSLLADVFKKKEAEGQKMSVDFIANQVKQNES